ncbi:MAG: energy-coupling factor ABC transporter ATP-binding protein [Treponema sp.]|nr:energy-coupling factor ABC transporter ATP-binding protein [Treponema sp.]
MIPAGTNGVIRIEKLCYSYDTERKILDSVDLSIFENEFTVILGQNGSGKTTLLKNISGLLRPVHGSIYLRGKDTARMSVADIAGEIGFVMQDPDSQLFEQTVYDEVAFSLKLSGGKKSGRNVSALQKKQISEKAEDALAAAGILDKRDAFPPSLGRAERINVVFASVLAMGPKIIMLDEPLAGQDCRGCRRIMGILADLHKKGHTVLMVTHNVNIAAEFARRVIVMKDAKIFMDGDAAGVFGQPEKLALAGILPPEITRLGQALRGRIPLEKDPLVPGELTAMLANL